jgi:hypothetical protein
MARISYVRDLERTILKALQGGGKPLSKFRFYWNVAGRCLDPQFVTLYGRDYADRNPIRPRQARLLEMHTKCRKCATCLRERQTMWKFRGVEEYGMASRTWFGTLTWAPEHRFVLEANSRVRLAKAGTDFDGLTASEQLIELAKSAGRELTLMVKRIRKNTRAPLRYLMVTELHKDGFPHHHMLLHEIDPASPIKWADLSSEWRFGFEKWKLATAEDVGYVTKYLVKTRGIVRVRASLAYGRGAPVESARPDAV